HQNTSLARDMRAGPTGGHELRVAACGNRLPASLREGDLIRRIGLAEHGLALPLVRPTIRNNGGVDIELVNPFSEPIAQVIAQLRGTSRCPYARIIGSRRFHCRCCGFCDRIHWRLAWPSGTATGRRCWNRVISAHCSLPSFLRATFCRAYSSGVMPMFSAISTSSALSRTVLGRDPLVVPRLTGAAAGAL